MPQHRNKEAIEVLAKNVRKYRMEQNLTLESLANSAGLEYSQISRIERGVINTSVSVIFSLAAALNIKPAQLLE